jgi:biopolymer transport protein ExbB/TolQ
MQFGLIEMWQQMGMVARTVSILLIGLSIVSLYIFIERQMTFARAKKRSQEVAPKLADLLKAGNIRDALSLASKKDNKASHLARVTAAGIQEFMEGKEARLSPEQQVETATRGCERAMVMYDQELKRGLAILATIATSAPFIGLFGTISGIINAFRGMALTGSGGIGAVAGGISEALVTTAFGIAVAIIALWCYNTLNTRVEVYGAEMTNTTSQVVDFFMRTAEAK